MVTISDLVQRAADNEGVTTREITERLAKKLKLSTDAIYKSRYRGSGLTLHTLYRYAKALNLNVRMEIE